MVAMRKNRYYAGEPPQMAVSYEKKTAGLGGAESSLESDCQEYIDQLNSFPRLREFLELMRGLKDRKIDYTTLIVKMKELLEGHSELIQGFNKFLPPGYKITTPPLVKLLSRKRKPPEFPDTDVVLQQAIGLVNKVKERFPHLVYRLFLKILSDVLHKRNKSSPKNSSTSVEDELESYKKIAVLFKGHKDLIQDFTPFLTTFPSIYDMRNIFTNMETCTPSYIRLPVDFPIPTATGRQDDQSQVLNDRYVSLRTKGSGRKIRSNHERQLFECEDDRFELDLEIERVKSASEGIKDMLGKIQMAKTPLNIYMEDHLSVIGLNCIKELECDQEGLNMLDWLMEDTRKALPVILNRLEKKKEVLEQSQHSERLKINQRLNELKEKELMNKSRRHESLYRRW